MSDRREYMRQWHARNPGRYSESNKRWQQANPEKVRAYKRKHRGQDAPTRPKPELCECCGNPPTARGMFEDHDHETGAFRGWLCNKCNASIGGLGDNALGVLKALDYLLQHTR